MRKEKSVKLFIRVFSLVSGVMCSCDKKNDTIDKSHDEEISNLQSIGGSGNQNGLNRQNSSGDSGVNDGSGGPKRPNPTKLDDSVFREKLSDVKKYFQSLPKSLADNVGGVMQAKVSIVSSDSWIQELGLKTTDRVFVVNAVNPKCDLGMGGINGALYNWAQSTGRKKADRRFLNRNPKNTEITEPGECSTFKFSGTNWSQLSACGVNTGSDIGKDKKFKSLDDAFVAQKKLYSDMLKYAEKEKAEAIVICAISTDIFASAGKNEDGTTFTDVKAKAVMFSAAYEAIIEFIAENSASKLHIIVNNFGDVQKVNF